MANAKNTPVADNQYHHWHENILHTAEKFCKKNNKNQHHLIKHGLVIFSSYHHHISYVILI